MAKKIWWSKCLTTEWSKLKEICQKTNLSPENALCEMIISTDALYYKYGRLSDKEYSISNNMNRLFQYDFQGKMLHIFFEDQILRDYLQKMQLADLDGIKEYLAENGIFHFSNKAAGTPLESIFDYYFCLHIPYEKYGYTFCVQMFADRTLFVMWEYKDHIIGSLVDSEYKSSVKNISRMTDIQKNNFLEKETLFKLAINTLAYMSCFPEYVKNGTPDIGKDEYNLQNKSIKLVVAKEIYDFEATPKNARKTMPHFRNGYFKYLKSDFYTKKHGQIIFVRSTMVKGTAKTVLTHKNIKNGNGLT